MKLNLSITHTKHHNITHIPVLMILWQHNRTYCKTTFERIGSKPLVLTNDDRRSNIPVGRNAWLPLNGTSVHCVSTQWPNKPTAVGTIRQCLEFKKHLYRNSSRVVHINSQFDLIINIFKQTHIQVYLGFNKVQASANAVIKDMETCQTFNIR